MTKSRIFTRRKLLFRSKTFLSSDSGNKSYVSVCDRCLQYAHIGTVVGMYNLPYFFGVFAILCVNENQTIVFFRSPYYFIISS